MTEAEKTMPSEKEVQEAKQLKKFKNFLPCGTIWGWDRKSLS